MKTVTARRKIPPMTIESFFRHVAARRIDVFGTLTLKFYKLDEDDGGGWRVDVSHGVSYGDTVPEAIRAAFDHVINYKPRRARLNPPDSFNKNGVRISYDYRKTDWILPK